MDYGFQVLDSGFSVGRTLIWFWTSIVSGIPDSLNYIPDSKAQDSVLLLIPEFPYLADVILNLSKNSYWYKQIRSLLSFVLIASMIKYEFILPCPTLSWTIVVCRIYDCYMAEHLLVLNYVDMPHPEIPGTCPYPHPHRTLIWLVYLSHNLPNTVR